MDSSEKRRDTDLIIRTNAMRNVLLSFIIPTYNASGTIKRCLDSIYAFTNKGLDFEIIVIDDCSTDSTVELVEDYANNHANIVLLRQPENHRQGAARNRGVAVACGKYIVFVDSDDESVEGVLSAIRFSEERELDMIAMCYVKVGSDGKTEKEVRLPYGRTELFSGVNLQTEFPFWGTAPWPYVYRKSFMDRVDYPFAEDVLFEDSDFVNVHLFHAKRMAYCDECGYVVHCNASSTTHTISYKHLADYALLGTRMLDFYESLEDKTSTYAQNILEGGSYNIMKAFHKLVRLGSRTEVRAFYDRLDGYYDRKRFLCYREPVYCWTRWTRFCLKHRGLVVSIMGIAIPIMRIKK